VLGVPVRPIVIMFKRKPLTKIVNEETDRYATEAPTRSFSNINDKNPSHSFPTVESSNEINRLSSADNLPVTISRKHRQEIEKLAHK
jgi:hypothetical protein